MGTMTHSTSCGCWDDKRMQAKSLELCVAHGKHSIKSISCYFYFMWKPREEKLLAQGHTACKRQSWNSTPGCLTLGLSLTIARVGSCCSSPSPRWQCWQQRRAESPPNYTWFQLARTNYWLGEGPRNRLSFPSLTESCWFQSVNSIFWDSQGWNEPKSANV